MAEAQVQYTRRSDGVSIAYTTLGQGAPILYCPHHQISLQHLLEDAAPLVTIRELAARTRLTAFDHAGIGASQRDVNDFSLEAQVSTIEAVAARLPDDQLTVVGFGSGSASAALYAVRHHGRVARMVSVNPTPFPAAAAASAASALENWSLLRRRAASATFPEGPVSGQRWYGEAMRDSVTAEVAAGYWEEFGRADLGEIYRRIPVPTLVCARPEGERRTGALELASLVPDCRVAVGTNLDTGNATAILEFMGIEAARDGLSAPTASSDTAIILFADVVESTAITARIGNEAFRERTRHLDDALREVIRDAGGSPVEGRTLGDGVLGVFTSAAQAIAAALQCGQHAERVGLQLHLGIHAGDVIREPGGGVSGLAVSMASRISDLTGPNEILVSGTVRDLARASTGVTFEDRGEHALKGIADAVRVYAVVSSGQ